MPAPRTGGLYKTCCPQIWTEFVDSLLGFKRFLLVGAVRQRLATGRRSCHRRADPTGTFRRWRAMFFGPRQSALVFSFCLPPPGVHKTLSDEVHSDWPPARAYTARSAGV